MGTERRGFSAAAPAYYRAHWRGELPLALSFWVNLVLVRTLLFLLGDFTHPPFVADPRFAAVASVLYIAAAHIGVQVWQIVGVVRACDRYSAAENAVVPVFAAYFGIAAGLLFTLSGAFTAIQSSFLEPSPLRAGDDRAAPQYALRLSADGRAIALDGEFEHGITARLESLLKRSPAVARIELSSRGGNVFEARGVGRLILDRGLDTHVSGTCVSACVRAFVAGRTRTLGPDAALGFHRYRLDADHPVPFADIAAEQARDRAFYSSRQVESAFLERIFDRAPPDLWIPPIARLLDAGVAHTLVADRPASGR